jgi:surface antigen
VNAFKIQYYTRKAIFRFLKRLPSLKRVYLNAFPATHIKPLDTYDYVFRFSAELLVFILALTVVISSVFAFNWSDDFVDKSYASKFLSYHPNLNTKLNEKNNTITTKVASHINFVPLAQAEDFGLSSTYLTEVQPEAEPEVSLDEEFLIQPKPDTLASLIAKQIKIYQSQAGDTLASIAKQHGISVQTLKSANQLTTDTLKPGWYLIILPTDGVLHKAKANDTLPDLVKKYGSNLDNIIAYNGLGSAEDIEPDQLIIIPGGKLPEAPKPAKRTPRDNSKVKPEGSVKPTYVDNGTGHIFPWGYCTWYVATRTHVPWGGNAKNWLANAKGFGAVISHTPIVGSIVVTTDNARYGHVAYVEQVEEGRILLSEMNYEKFGKVNNRWLSTSSKTIRGYIYP